jgi:hypothetical protein
MESKPILVLLSKLSIVSEKDFYIKLTEGVLLTRVFFFNCPRNEEYTHHENEQHTKTAGCITNAKFPLIRKNVMNFVLAETNQKSLQRLTLPSSFIHSKNSFSSSPIFGL